MRAISRLQNLGSFLEHEDLVEEELIPTVCDFFSGCYEYYPGQIYPNHLLKLSYSICSNNAV
jgi:hypothetical protein